MGWATVVKQLLLLVNNALASIRENKLIELGRFRVKEEQNNEQVIEENRTKNYGLHLDTLSDDELDRLSKQDSNSD